MAVVTRYFSTAAAGSGDGTSWANRAEMFPSGSWNTIIKGFDFSGTDQLECRLEGGKSYAFSGPTLFSTDFLSAPTAANRLTIAACDAFGNRWSPPDPKWKSCQPKWDTSGMPLITCGATLTVTLLSWGISVSLYGIGFQTGPSGAYQGIAALRGDAILDWCYFRHTAGGNSGLLSLENGVYIHNTVFEATHNGYPYFVGGAGLTLQNCRLQGAPSPSGTAVGLSATSLSAQTLIGSTFLNLPGEALKVTGSNSLIAASRCVFNNCGTAISIPSPGVVGGYIRNSFITNCGVGVSGVGNMEIRNSRFRNTTNTNFSGRTRTLNSIDESTAETTTDEYADPNNGNFLTKQSSQFWGKSIGVADEIPTPEQIADAVWNHGGRSLT